MNWKKRKGNGNAVRFIYYPLTLTTTAYFLEENETHEVMEQWCCILTGNDTYNIDAKYFGSKDLTPRHGKDMKEKEVNGHVTKRIEMIGQAMTTNRNSKLPKGWKTLLTITAPFGKTWSERTWKQLKDMSGQVSKWIERKGKATAIGKDYHPKAGTCYILAPSSLLITCLGSCGPRCPVSSNLDLNAFPV